jgi:hypothetical protein
MGEELGVLRWLSRYSEVTGNGLDDRSSIHVRGKRFFSLLYYPESDSCMHVHEMS